MRIIRLIIEIVQMIVSFSKQIWDILRKFWEKEEKQQDYTESVYIDHTGAVIDIWQESTIYNNENGKPNDNETDLKISDVPKMVEESRIFTKYKDGKAILYVNLKMETVPLCTINEIENIQESYLQFFTGGVSVASWVQTPIGKVCVTTMTNLLNMSPDSRKEFHQLNPYIVLNKKPRRIVTVYGGEFYNAEVQIHFKGRQRATDYVAITKVYAVVTTMIRTKKIHKKEATMILFMTDSSSEYVTDGCIARAKGMIFIIVAAYDLQQIKKTLFLAASLAQHNVVYDIEFFSR